MYNLFNSKSIICNGFGGVGIVTKPETIDNPKRHGVVPDFEISLQGKSVWLDIESATNEMIQEWIINIEKITPSTPKEEYILSEAHRILCKRLEWTPKVLSH